MSRRQRRCQQITDQWAAGDLRTYHRLLRAECDRVNRLTGRVVTVHHAVNGESWGADQLSRSFRSVCDPQLRQVWRARAQAARQRRGR